MRLENRKDHVLLAMAREVFETQRFDRVRPRPAAGRFLSSVRFMMFLLISSCSGGITSSVAFIIQDTGPVADVCDAADSIVPALVLLPTVFGGLLLV